ncbi:hypothetical protein QVD99_000377 [Batrachochytrium dendrobatidis]|nr:hypothetical protein O5D80_007952 [Batrachochytrium dendrobatidis]KAK5672892.1 hypothetical protein QVD99_000377 [Batrachochytrium dendrobatidis]
MEHKCNHGIPDSGESTVSTITDQKLLPRHLQPIPAPLPAASLEEDEYIAGVSTIIERDFFPNLRKLRVQNDLLDAVQNANHLQVKTLSSQLAQLTGKTSDYSSTPTPYPHRSVSKDTLNLHASDSFMAPPTPSAASFSDSATPNPLNSMNPASSESQSLDTSISLDKFQTKYTSEDNASFLNILELQNEAKREQYHWLYDKEKKQLRLKNEHSIESTNTATSAMTTSGVELLVETPDRMIKPIDEWKFKAKNTLMYYPDGAPLTLADMGELRGQPKSITHSATRFNAPHSSELARTLSSGMSSASSESGRLNTQRVWSQMAKATPGLFHGAAGALTDSPRVSGYGFVPTTPTFTPDEDIDPSELLTWGMIEGTPLLADSGMDHSGGPSFKIPATPRREEISMRLSEKASKALKRRSDIAAGGSSSRAASPAAGKMTTLGNAQSLKATSFQQRMLSPAAQTLLANSSLRKSGLRIGSGSSGNLDTQLRASYSGPVLTPWRTSSHRTPTASQNSISTPHVTSGFDSLQSSRSKRNLSTTDDLLGI